MLTPPYNVGILRRALEGLPDQANITDVERFYTHAIRAATGASGKLAITPENLRDAVNTACSGELYVRGEDWRNECSAVLRELALILKGFDPPSHR